MKYVILTALLLSSQAYAAPQRALANDDELQVCGILEKLAAYTAGPGISGVQVELRSEKSSSVETIQLDGAIDNELFSASDKEAMYNLFTQAYFSGKRICLHRFQSKKDGKRKIHTLVISNK